MCTDELLYDVKPRPTVALTTHILGNSPTSIINLNFAMFHLPITSSPSPLIYTPHLQPSCFGCRSHEVLVNDSIRLEPVWLSELLKVATTFRYLRHVCYDRSKYTRTQIVPGCYANYVAVSWHMAARLAWAGLFWLAFHTQRGNPPPYATVVGPTLTMYDDIIALRA